MPYRISQFWRDVAAGRRQLSPRWAKKDAQMARDDPTLLDELSTAA
jgi:hypothetical protein